MTWTKRPELLLLVVAAFFAPIAGGHVPTEPLAGASILGGLAGDPSSVAATRLLLGLLILGSLAFSFLRQRSVPLPRGRLVLWIGLFLGLLGAAAVLSDFRAQSVEAFLLWVLAGGAFFGAIAASGRRTGPVVLLAALAAAGIILGGRAVLDYLDMVGREPTYRAFATWNNPNSVAGMYAILGVLCAGLVAGQERVLTLLGVAGALFCGAGLALTQSKGGILAMGAGLVVWLVVYLLWKGKPKGLAGAGILVLGFLLAFAWQSSAISQATSGAGAGRLMSSGGEAEQSQGFRTLLWKSAVDLTLEKPIVGWGSGTFRYESGRPGRQTPTAYAHQTYLQVSYEGGLFALALLGAIAAVWLRLVFRGSKSLTPEQNSLRAAIVGAVAAFGANGFIESNLAFTGIAITVFLLLGLGLQLCADGSSPELMPRPMRLGIVLTSCAVPLLLLSLFAAGEARKSAIIAYAGTRQTSEMLEMSRTLESTMPYDGEALLLAGTYEVQDNERRGRLLQQASLKFPAPRTIRLYARWLADNENPNTAINVLNRVFVRDPYNLFSRRLMIELQSKAGNEEGAREAAEKLVSIEQTSYYQVNSLGDLVPVETCAGRLWLARRESDPVKVIELMKPAVAIYRAYVARTLPLIKMMSEAGLSYGGQSKESARENLNDALEAADLLAQASQREGDKEGSALASESSSKFREELESL